MIETLGEAQFKLKEAEINLNELRQQLDAAQASESMIHDLIDRNFDLSEEVSDLRQRIEVSESLEEVYTEMDENHEAVQDLMHKSILCYETQLAARDQQIIELSRSHARFDTLSSQLQKTIAHLVQYVLDIFPNVIN